MCRLILCRHAQTSWNFERRIQGLEDIDLDACGYAQAEALAQKIGQLGLRKPRLFSSPLLRALSTARPMAETLGLELAVEPDLLEVDMGSHTGVRLSSLREDPAWAAHLADPWAARYDKFGESAASVRERMLRAIDRHCREDSALGDVVFVTHAGLIRHAVLALLEIPGRHLYQIRISNASMTAFDLGGTCVKSLGINWRLDFKI